MDKITEEFLLTNGFKRQGLCTYSKNGVKVAQLVPTNLGWYSVTITLLNGLENVVHTKSVDIMKKFIKLCGREDVLSTKN